jgi:hypothetical protein
LSPKPANGKSNLTADDENEGEFKGEGELKGERISP